MSANSYTVCEVMYAIGKYMHAILSYTSNIVFEHCYIDCVVFRLHFRTGFCTCISMVICKINWYIRSWLSDYISFSFYESYYRHDIYWILVTSLMATSALIKVSIVYGVYRHLYMQLIHWHCCWLSTHSRGIVLLRSIGNTITITTTTTTATTTTFTTTTTSTTTTTDAASAAATTTTVITCTQ